MFYSLKMQDSGAKTILLEICYQYLKNANYSQNTQQNQIQQCVERVMKHD